jgi:hypothetical protein
LHNLMSSPSPNGRASWREADHDTEKDCRTDGRERDRTRGQWLRRHGFVIEEREVGQAAHQTGCQRRARRQVVLRLRLRGSEEGAEEPRLRPQGRRTRFGPHEVGTWLRGRRRGRRLRHPRRRYVRCDRLHRQTRSGVPGQKVLGVRRPRRLRGRRGRLFQQMRERPLGHLQAERSRLSRRVPRRETGRRKGPEGCGVTEQSRCGRRCQDPGYRGFRCRIQGGLHRGRRQEFQRTRPIRRRRQAVRRPGQGQGDQ